MKISLRRTALLALLLILIWLVLALAFYTGVTSHVLGANDYYSRWMGAKLFFLNGVDPYSNEATLQIQTGMYGHPARPDQDQVAFAYPFYAAFFTLPFVSLPYAVAESLWIALLMILVSGSAIALAVHFGWALKPLGLFGLLAFTLAYYPTLRGLFLGQYTLIAFASLGFGIVLLGRGLDGWGGIVLAAASVKPHVAVLVLAVILGWGLVHRRWRLLAGFAGAMVLLVGAATALLPSWPGEFANAVVRYQDYIHIGPPLQVWAELLVPAGWSGVATALLTGFVLLLLLIRWVKSIGGEWKSYLPTVEWAMLVTTLAMLRTATTDQTMLLVIWIHWLSEWKQGRSTAAAAILSLATIGLPWLIFLATLHGNQEAPIATTTAVSLTLVVYLVLHARRAFPRLYAHLCQFTFLSPRARRS